MQLANGIPRGETGNVASTDRSSVRSLDRPCPILSGTLRVIHQDAHNVNWLSATVIHMAIRSSGD